MTTPEGTDYQQVLTDHLYLFTKYIVADDFVDRLISDKILSLDDKDLILNPFTNQSRRERAAKLIEVLYTRGVNGFNKFLEILEYQYPHVFKEVTKKEPRTPPAGFRCNRTSDQLLLLNDLPRLAQHIKDQHLQNVDLQEELTVLQGLLVLSKEENTALEHDIESLKHLKPKNEELLVQLANVENDKRELQININKEMQRTFKYIEERDEFQEKCQNLQIQYDMLFKKYKELESTKLTGRGSAAAERPAKPDTKPAINTTETRALHTVAQIQILREELEMYRNHSEELSHRLQDAEENVQNLESKLEAKAKELKKQIAANRKDNERLKELSVRFEAFCKLMHAKEEEIMELNKHKIEEQQKVTRLIQEKNDLFWGQHKAEKERDELLTELDTLRARLSGTSQDFPVENIRSEEDPAHRSSDEIEDEEHVQHPYFDRHCKRRKFFKKRSIPGRCGTRQESGIEACNTNLANISTMAEIDSTEFYKASTLPAAAETPEMVFQREIAYLRYSKKEDHMKLKEQNSMNTQHGSIHEPQVNYRRAEKITRQKGAVSHPLDAVADESDKASGSTFYLARTPGTMSDRAQCDSVRDEISSAPDSEDTCSSGGFSLMEDFPVYDVKKELIPKPCTQVNSHGAPDSSQYRTVTVKFPVLNLPESKGNLEIVGGNHTGIFISKVLPKTVELSEGEEIKEIVYTPNDKAQPVETVLTGCTLEEAHRLLSEEFIRPRKEREVKLRVRKCRLEYDYACKWMAENQGTGDFLFIRCNATIETRADDSVTPCVGEIFQIKNSRYNRKQWLGYRVNQANGSIENTEIKIPNSQEASLRRVPSVLGRRMSEDGQEDKGTRRIAVRLKGTAYERVLPMKATIQLPVYVVGPTQIVNALLDRISSQLSTDFLVKSADGGNEEAEMMRNDIHAVKRSTIERLQTMKAYRGIVVLINVTKEIGTDMCSNMFGEVLGRKTDSDMVEYCKNLKQKLTESGHKFGELCLPDIDTADGLLEEFVACVKRAQGRTLWLTATDMDPLVANQYPRYLGQNCDLNKIIIAVQRAQSLDHS